MAIYHDVIAYVTNATQPVSYENVMKDLGITREQAHAARSRIIRLCDDIRPVGQGMMVFCPDWKQKFPDEWDAVRDSSRSNGSKGKVRKKNQLMPNIIGPMIQVFNVVAINIYSDRVTVQHTDNSYTEFSGTLVLGDYHSGRKGLASWHLQGSLGWTTGAPLKQDGKTG